MKIILHLLKIIAEDGVSDGKWGGIWFFPKRDEGGKEFLQKLAVALKDHLYPHTELASGFTIRHKKKVPVITYETESPSFSVFYNKLPTSNNRNIFSNKFNIQVCLKDYQYRRSKENLSISPAEDIIPDDFSEQVDKCIDEIFTKNVNKEPTASNSEASINESKLKRKREANDEKKLRTVKLKKDDQPPKSIPNAFFGNSVKEPQALTTNENCNVLQLTAVQTIKNHFISKIFILNEEHFIIKLLGTSVNPTEYQLWNLAGYVKTIAQNIDAFNITSNKNLICALGDKILVFNIQLKILKTINIILKDDWKVTSIVELSNGNIVYGTNKGTLYILNEKGEYLKNIIFPENNYIKEIFIQDEFICVAYNSKLMIFNQSGECVDECYGTFTKASVSCGKLMSVIDNKVTYSDSERRKDKLLVDNDKSVCASAFEVFSNDLLAVGDAYGKVRLFDQSLKCIQTLSCLKGRIDVVVQLNSNIIIAATQDDLAICQMGKVEQKYEVRSLQGTLADNEVSSLCNRFILYYANNQSSQLRSLIKEGFSLSLLLTNQATDHQKNTIRSYLLQPQNNDRYKMLFQLAIETKGFVENFVFKAGLATQLFVAAATKDCPEIFNYLLTKTDYSTYINFEKVHAELNDLNWNYEGSNTSEWIKLYKLFSKGYLEKLKSYEIQDPLSIDVNDPFINKVDECYLELFKERLKLPENKNEAIKVGIAELYNLLHNNPQIVLKYLKLFNDEFQTYYHNKTGLNFLDCTYPKFKLVNDLYYPFFEKDNKKINKSHALHEFLQLFLQKNHFAKLFKVQGYITDAVICKILKDGGVPLEGQLGIGLFHGKYSHVLQIIFLIYALQEKRITDHFNKIKFTAPMMVAAMIELECFAKVFDIRIPNKISFTDPNRLSSFIMQYGNNFGMQLLQNYLIATFGSGAIKLLDLYNSNKKTNTRSFSEILGFANKTTSDMSGLFEMLHCWPLTSFFRINGAIWSQKLKEENKGNKVVAHKEQPHEYLIVEYPAVEVEEKTLAPMESEFTNLKLGSSERKNMYDDVAINMLYNPWQVHRPDANLSDLISKVVEHIKGGRMEKWMLTHVIAAIPNDKGKGKEFYRAMADSLLESNKEGMSPVNQMR